MTSSTMFTSLQAALGSQYRIDRELGRGGMGVVYLARDLTLDRPVAVKIVHPDLTTNRAVGARFLTEARTIAKLRHSNIVAVHAAGELDGQFYYVMDYLPGESLRHRLEREGKLPLHLVFRIAANIAEALDVASEAGVIHRDLKPENILLEGPPEEPRALLADFGIARLVEEGGGVTGPGAVMGTPAYMSPEQAAGEDLDGRSDLYSLGIVTYEMLVGAPPFAGTHRSVISKQILDVPAPIAILRPDLPASAAAAVMRALEKLPEARWATGKAFRQALLGESPTPTPVAIPRGRSWPMKALLGTTLSVLAFLALALSTGRDRPPLGVDPRHSLLILPFTNTRGDARSQWLRDGSVSMLSLALSQWRDLTVVDQDRVHDLLATSTQSEGSIGLDLARRLARRSGVWTVVLGDFERVGDSLHLVARTYDVASGGRIHTAQVNGQASEDVRPLFDELAAKILDLTGAPRNSRASLVSVTTQSLEAYQAYLRGVDALNHWRLTEASDALELAVGIDSAFSLANFRLAVARGWMSAMDTIGLAAIRRATRSAERLPPRERQLIEGYRTFVEGDYERGMTLYGQLIARDSADVEAWYGFSDAAFHGGYARSRVEMLSQSLRGLRRVIGLDSTFGLAYEHIGAMLTDASNAHGWLRLVGQDSIASRKDGPPSDSATLAIGRQQANLQAVELAQAWTRLQPGTPRAQYHLYKAYLAGNRIAEARQTVQQLRAMHPDSLRAFFSLLDARAQFVGGDIAGAGRAIRAALPQVKAGTFQVLDFAPEPLLDIMTGANALGYLGDLQGAAQMIRLGHDLRHARHEARDSTEKVRDDDLWELSRLGALYAASGTRTDRLRTIWSRGFELVAASSDELRPMGLAYLAPTALGLLLGPSGDPSAVAEIARLADQPTPPVVRALLAARSGDSNRARALLLEASSTKSLDGKGFRWDDGNDFRPLRAEVNFEIGSFDRVIEELKGFQTEDLGRRGFDPRWILLPRVRLLRGQAFDRLGRAAEAATEYRAVINQWAGADTELLPVVQQARRYLARLAGTPEVH